MKSAQPVRLQCVARELLELAQLRRRPSTSSRADASAPGWCSSGWGSQHLVERAKLVPLPKPRRDHAGRRCDNRELSPACMRVRRGVGTLLPEPRHASARRDSFDIGSSTAWAPRLGKGTSFRSFDKVLPYPQPLLHQPGALASARDDEGRRRAARAQGARAQRIEAGPLADFITIVDLDLGFACIARCPTPKVALSANDQTDFRFKAGGIDIGSTITRGAVRSVDRPTISRGSAPPSTRC